MILPVVQYGDPVLRQRGKAVAILTSEIRELIADMLETMHEARGVGLAAQQVGETLQVMVLDIRGVEDRPSTLEIGGRPVDVEAHMPMALVNPELCPCGDPVTGPEGCLSFPEIYAEVTRPESVEVVALNEQGQTIQFRAGGLLARAIQHENDHLRGILFIDRMAADTKRGLRPELDALMEGTRASLKVRVKVGQ